MLAAADAYEAAGDSKAAVNVLRPMYFKFPDSKEKPRIIESMARNYLLLKNRRGNVDSAAARLTQGSTLVGDPKLSKPLVLPDGKQLPAGMPFAQALDEVRRYTGREAAKALPDFRLPQPRKRTKEEKLANPNWPFLPAGDATVINDVTALVPAARLLPSGPPRHLDRRPGALDFHRRVEQAARLERVGGAAAAAARVAGRGPACVGRHRAGTRARRRGGGEVEAGIEEPAAGGSDAAGGRVGRAARWGRSPTSRSARCR